MRKQKPGARLENWAVVESANIARYQALRAGSLLVGKVFNHPTIGEGTFIFTSPIVRFDEKTNVAETRNTSYRLGQASREYKIWAEEQDGSRCLGLLEYSRKHFCCRSQNDLVEGVGVERRLRTDIGS